MIFFSGVIIFIFLGFFISGLAISVLAAMIIFKKADAGFNFFYAGLAMVGLCVTGTSAFWFNLLAPVLLSI